MIKAPTYHPTSPRVRLASVAASLPSQTRSSDEIDARIAECSSGYRHRPGILEALSGVRARRVAADEVQCSDLAADAAARALADAGLSPADVDVMIFASAGQDMIEPATAHIVQQKLGSQCQVFDVKNACNSFLNGLQLAESLIISGSCETAVVTTGEICSRAINWRLNSFDEFKRLFPGYTMGDAGAAAVLTRSPDDRGIVYRRFEAVSQHWDIATVPCGGSLHPRGDEYTYLQGDGAKLKDAFVQHGPALFKKMLCDARICVSEFDRAVVHQASVSYVEEMLDLIGIPTDIVEHTVGELGNMASASLPVAYARALAAGRISAGDRVLWLGLGSGISIGVMVVDV
jgi:3-oxoacyl-[acyl-carrier-protein] synthase-3